MESASNINECDNIPSVPLEDKIEKLQCESKALKEKLEKLYNEALKAKEGRDEVIKKQNVLKTNFSILLNTARSELKRKDSTIESLQKELNFLQKKSKRTNEDGQYLERDSDLNIGKVKVECLVKNESDQEVNQEASYHEIRHNKSALLCKIDNNRKLKEENFTKHENLADVRKDMTIDNKTENLSQYGQCRNNEREIFKKDNFSRCNDEYRSRDIQVNKREESRNHWEGSNRNQNSKSYGSYSRNDSNFRPSNRRESYDGAYRSHRDPAYPSKTRGGRS